MAVNQSHTMLMRLERGGLVERAPDPDDGRASVVSLTKGGLAVQDRVFHVFLTASEELLDALSAAKRRDADRVLRGLLDAFEARVG